MENSNPSLEKIVANIVQELAEETGHRGTDIVTRNSPSDLHQIIRSKITTPISLNPRPLPESLASKLKRLDKVPVEEPDFTSEELPDNSDMSKGPSKTPKPSPAGTPKKSEFLCEVPTSDSGYVFGDEEMEYFLHQRKLRKPASIEQISLALWWVSTAVVKCRENCTEMRRQMEKDRLQLEEIADSRRDCESLERHLRAAIVDLQEQLDGASSAAHKLEEDNNELTKKLAALTTSAEELTDEDRRAEVYRKLSDLNPSLIPKNWVNIDSSTPIGYFSYPIFTQNGKFYNPYKTCSTETDVAEINSNLNCSFPYMTVATLALMALPDSVKPALVRELSSANSPLEFFLSLNAIARMSPIVNQCIKVLRDSRDKEDIRELSKSMSNVREQLNLNHTTMISFMDQTEDHRNVLVNVSKTIKTFLEVFPDAPKIIKDLKIQAPSSIVYFIKIDDLNLALKGDNPRNAALIRDQQCCDSLLETIVIDALTPHLPAIFSILRDGFTVTAKHLLLSLVSPLAKEPFTSCTVEQWTPGSN